LGVVEAFAFCYVTWIGMRAADDHGSKRVVEQGKTGSSGHRSAGQRPHGCGNDGVGVGRGQSSVSGRPSVHRRPEDEIQRHFGVDFRIQLAAGDAAVPDLRNGCSADVHLNAPSTALTAVTENVESTLGSGDYSTALTDLDDGPSTVLYAFLIGYPETLGSGLISPNLGLLTNTADGAVSGQIDRLQQLGNTLADELSAVGGGNLKTTPT
jgi:hypothetical protein